MLATSTRSRLVSSVSGEPHSSWGKARPVWEPTLPRLSGGVAPKSRKRRTVLYAIIAFFVGATLGGLAVGLGAASKSHYPVPSSGVILLGINRDAIRMIERAATKEGLNRSDFMLQAIEAAVRSSTGEELPEDRPSPPRNIEVA